MYSSFSGELKNGLDQTINYVFSHHEPSEYYKCFHIKIVWKDVYICSRCLGVYLGILIGVLIIFFNLLSPIFSLIIIAILPSLALIDWSISILTSIKSNNSIRAITGIFLGLSYCIGIFLVLKNSYIIQVVTIGLCYMLIAFTMLYIKLLR